jgi:hypothetical protein
VSTLVLSRTVILHGFHFSVSDAMHQFEIKLKNIEMCFSSNRIAMQSGNISLARRGSCSAEVMQGLRAKCSARSHSSQQRLVSDSSAGSASETSELPPDILQSRKCIFGLIKCQSFRG